MSYRDGEAVVREMLAGKRADALSRARSLGYAQRSVVDEAAVAHVEALHDRTMPFLFDEVQSSDEARAAIRKLDELIAAYDAVLARSSTLLVSSVLDVEAALTPPEGWRGTAAGAARLAGEMHVARDAVDRLEVRERGVAVTAGPWALLVGLDESGDETWAEGRITVAIPVAVPHVRARVERNTDGALQDLGVVDEIETANARFDNLYWIEGNREAAFACATPLIRRLLIGLHEHRGALEAGGGIARLSWSGPWQALGSSPVPKDMVPAILELRAAFCG